MIQVRSDLSMINDTETSFEETLFAEISEAGIRYKVLTIYYKHRNSKKLFLELLDKVLEKHKSVEIPFEILTSIFLKITSWLRVKKCDHL